METVFPALDDAENGMATNAIENSSASAVNRRVRLATRTHEPVRTNPGPLVTERLPRSYLEVYRQ